MPGKIAFTDDACVQVVLSGWMAERFQADLRRRGLFLLPLPHSDEDELPTYFVGVSDEALAAVTPPANQRGE